MSAIIGRLDPTNFDGTGLDIRGTDGFDRIFGSERGDFVDAGDGRDVIFGGAGDDFIDAGAGQDFGSLGQGDDSVIGGAGEDLIFGRSGDDFLEGNQDDDIIFGGSGDDIINGGLGNDTIFGGAGDDTIVGSRGSDSLVGNQGQDVFLFDIQDFADGSIDSIADFEFGEDSIIISGLDDGARISFDSTTGSISLDGQNIIDLEGAEGNDLDINEDDDGNFEIM